MDVWFALEFGKSVVFCGMYFFCIALSRIIVITSYALLFALYEVCKRDVEYGSRSDRSEESQLSE